MQDISDNTLLDRLVKGGIGALPGDRLGELANSLEARATETGLAAPLFVAQAMRTVHALFRQHDEAGGIRVDFVEELDTLLRQRISEIQLGEPLQAAAKAKLLREEVEERVNNYDPWQT